MRRLMCLCFAVLLLVPAGALCEGGAGDNLFAWTYEPQGPGLSRALDAVPTAPGGLFVVGETDSAGPLFGSARGGLDAVALCLGADGSVLWQYRLGGAADDRFTHALALSDGRFLALGTTLSTDGDAQASRGETDVFLAVFAKEGTLLFTKLLGGTQRDEILAVCQTESGALILAGQTQSRNGDLTSNNGGYDAWITGVSPEDGKPLWKDRYGDELDDAFDGLLPLADGVLAVGVTGTDAENGVRGALIALPYAADGTRAWEAPVRLSSAGESQSRLIGLERMGTDWLLLGHTNARSAMLATRGGADVWMLRLLSSGNVQWQRTFGGSGDDIPNQIIPFGEEGYLLLCVTNSSDGQVTGAHGADDLWVAYVSTSGAGQVRWQQTIGGGARSIPAGIALTAEGNILVAGTSFSQDGDIGIHRATRVGFLTLLAPNGNLLWTDVIDRNAEVTLNRLVARDGAAFLVGGARAAGEEQRMYIARLSPDVFPQP